MPKALFLISDFSNQKSGIYQYFSELFKVWNSEILDVSKKTEFEPVVISMRDISLPLGELKQSQYFSELEAEHPGLKVYEMQKDGVTIYFLEAGINVEERNLFHGELYKKFRIKSEKACQTLSNYDALTAYWKYAPLLAEFLAKRENVAIIDANDWSAFPAGFLSKEKIQKPLVCRFHSGEFGRSLGNPDLLMPQVLCEAAALMEADFIEAISVTEAKFEIYNLLAEKRKIVDSLKSERDGKWLKMQEFKDVRFQEFLLFDSQDFQSITKMAAGITYGVDLNSWKEVSVAQIYQGRGIFEKILPGKTKYILYMGKAEWRKGIDTLISAFSSIQRNDVGLIISSSMPEKEYLDYSTKLKEMGLEGKAAIYNGWLDNYVKKAIICAADIVALPSLYEPFSSLTLEVLSADLACEANDLSGPVLVVGDTGGITEIIRNGYNGFKVPMEEDRFDLKPEYLTRVLEMVVADDKLQAKISKGAIETIQKKAFEWDNVLKLIFQTYSKSKDNHFELSKMQRDDVEPIPVYAEKTGLVENYVQV